MALFFTYVLPLLLPTALYVLWRMIWLRRPAEDMSQPSDDSGGATVASSGDLWRGAPWFWLALAGALLLAAVLLVGVFVHGAPPRGQYVPPRLEDGHIVPGELRSNDAPADSPSGAR